MCSAPPSAPPARAKGNFRVLLGVAVNEATGDVYVVDRGNNRVEYFSSAGVFLGQFNGAGAPTGVFSDPEAIAVDNSTNPLDPSAGDVYVMDVGHSVIDKFSSTGAYVGQLTETSGGSHLEGLYGVAVDSNGLVWVYQYVGEIYSFSNALVNAFLSKRNSPEGAGPAIRGFAVDSEDNLYVNHYVGEVSRFEKLNSSGARLILGVGSETSSAAAVDPTSNAVYIDNLSSVGEFSSTGALLDRFGSGHLSNGSGVAVNASSELVYVADETADTVSIFHTILVADVSTGAVSAQVGGTATVGGVVNPDGVQVTSCVFEYGPTVAYGSSAPCVPSSPGSGVAPVAVSGTLTGLQLGVGYHYRLVAGNANGTSHGEDGTFVHGATVEDESVSNVASSSATLQAQIDPQGLDTTYRFEYGTSEAYGSSIPVPDGIVGSGPTGVSVSAHPQELIASTTYHYRVAVSTAIGTKLRSGPDIHDPARWWRARAPGRSPVGTGDAAGQARRADQPPPR